MGGVSFGATWGLHKRMLGATAHLTTCRLMLRNALVSSSRTGKQRPTIIRELGGGDGTSSKGIPPESIKVPWRDCCERRRLPKHIIVIFRIRNILLMVQEIYGGFEVKGKKKKARHVCEAARSCKVQSSCSLPALPEL